MIAPPRSGCGRGEYHPQLDGLRALAVFAVLLHHFRGTSLVPFGQIGVWLFFVLSGYLITGILLQCRARAEAEAYPKRIPLRQFYLRRCLRIFPLYYLAVFLMAALDEGLAREHLLWNLFYLGNVRTALEGDWNGRTVHFWSLAVEEQFYLLWPLLIMFCSWRALKPLVLGLVGLGIVSKIVVFYLAGRNNIPAYVLPVCCLDTLGAGALLAILQWQGARVGAHALAAGVALIAVGASTFKSWPQGITWTVCTSAGVALAGAWVIGRASDGFAGGTGRVLASRPMTKVGQISYGMYVWHPFLIPLLPLLLERLEIESAPRIVNLLVLVPITIAVAWMSWEWFERPINALKRHVPYLPPPPASRPRQRRSKPHAGDLTRCPAETEAGMGMIPFRHPKG